MLADTPGRDAVTSCADTVNGRCIRPRQREVRKEHVNSDAAHPSTALLEVGSIRCDLGVEPTDGGLGISLAEVAVYVEDHPYRVVVQWEEFRCLLEPALLSSDGTRTGRCSFGRDLPGPDPRQRGPRGP